MKFTLDNLLTLIKGDDGKLRNKFIENLPNVKTFRVVIQGKRLPLEKIGITKSVKSHLEIEKYKNKRINRWFEHQIIRLIKYRKEERYWTLAKILLTNKVFYVVHLNKVIPTWYRQSHMRDPIILFKKIKRISKEFSGNVDFRRVYIPKNETDFRPLGVPTPEWRIYLSMLNTILIIWLEPYWHVSQHGYFPRKGTLTVWREIFKKINSPDIYEFDLKQFFSSVNIQHLSSILRKRNMPKWWVEYIENINKSKPKLQEKDKVDESATREAQELEAGILNREQRWYQPVREFIKANGAELWKQLVMEDTGGFSLYHEYEMVQLQAALFASFPETPTSELVGETGFHSVTESLPQGGSISPTLSVQVLKWIFEYEASPTMYADDGIIFGKPKLDHPKYKAAGIVFHSAKSGWVKQAGRWLKPLKFCGLVYDGNRDELWSETKKGNYLLIKKNELKRIQKASEWFISTGPNHKSQTWHTLFLSRISGFVQAALYNGTYELSSNWEKWKIDRCSTSWLASKSAKRIFKKARIKPTLYNASSLASRWLLNIL